MAWTGRVGTAVLLIALGGGRAPANPPAPGIVFVLGGIGGLDPIQTWAPLVLPHAGVPHEIRVFEWTHGKCRVLRDLQDTRHLCAQGARLAEEVLAIKSREPWRPIYLVGHSAGTGVILAATEHLPPATVERIVLLSAAVSPGFDLTAALKATRREVVSFHSTFDRLTLGLGTTLFGTVDRLYVTSAGAEGFVVPDELDAEGGKLYERLVQVPWTMKWFFECCYTGPHHANCMPLFLSHRIAPWLMPDP